MIESTTTIQEFLASIYPFNQLSITSIERIAEKLEPLRYRMGQAILVRETLPARVVILYQGQARLLGYAPGASAPDTLQLLKPGSIIGWTSLLRGVPCETAIASVETLCLTLKASDFLSLIELEPAIANAFCNHCSLIEVFDLLGAELERRGKIPDNLKELAIATVKQATILNLPPGKTPLQQLDPNLLWLVSSKGSNYDVGERLLPGSDRANITGEVRLVGFTDPTLPIAESDVNIASLSDTGIWANAPFAPERPEETEEVEPGQGIKYPHISGRGPVDGTLACFQMLAQQLRMPFRRDVLRRALVSNFERTGSISIQLCGALAELMGLTSQLVNVPAIAISKLPTPVLIPWQDSYAILYKATEKEIVLGIPEQGIIRKKPADFAETWGEEGQVLLLQPTKETPQKRFGLSWFLPAIKKHRTVLIEVFIASLFVQLLGLANPLITQVIIDKVIIQNGINTLNVLGFLLIAMAIVEGIITWLRTNLFVDTTNRIDLSLGSEVIDHLLRLPLRYFEKRPVGEISSRINELENIRSFLTGTALTVVLDAIFSVIYIVVMIFYSWLLTIVALATVPLFALITFIFAPIIRSQTRTKAERNADTQSYLVEVVSGIQTVKAQNIELNSRWQWQSRYGRYISASFENVLTSNTASSLSNFLNKLSSLLLLWVGAYLVLQQQLTLGQLIAFRIIAGYVTSPLLRLIQLWQNFQETALSLERLADILDTPQETEIAGRNNIPMPAIVGAVQYESVTFSFAKSPNPQLNNVHLDIEAGMFVGVVGQSGAGKSTLTKLLPRLYELDSGRIKIDGYDINKVELYSLRQQIGMVLQDTLLFDTTVQENIALTMPDATAEEIVEAAKIACAHDFIMNLPNGYETRVGERGSALSGGQRQRIAIARTVLQNPPLLILDEATSALDYATERQVCLNLAQVFKGRTVFFITHRLGTIQNADVILMMSQGRIAEQGTHTELMDLTGLYYCLYQQQEAQG
ncbi:peptidase domain-containing ABC transporter [Nostoc sp. 'Peltigera membranacea cyanobiont' N6]|uniref:peptidase domain-containing ABC transporter n=1 Tax=Nostoc sp. 'Peltigera membranacea cyanobiont' N6 TaxID=1261031 RepID=UPI000CF30566|nr:peptidase domain-containing ABC transporter [Nostoc sp. 'Peltigera membranacea cyanobiont' N6]AVH68165.1 ABC-type bacteriocin/lantibiotic exporter SunT [Nostoc sp. 'Peltigera membranacea cyanobiont' N6]